MVCAGLAMDLRETNAFHRLPLPDFNGIPTGKRGGLQPVMLSPNCRTNIVAVKYPNCHSLAFAVGDIGRG
jgi:hypothetical protein